MILPVGPDLFPLAPSALPEIKSLSIMDKAWISPAGFTLKLSHTKPDLASPPEFGAKTSSLEHFMGQLEGCVRPAVVVLRSRDAPVRSWGYLVGFQKA